MQHCSGIIMLRFFLIKQILYHLQNIFTTSTVTALYINKLKEMILFCVRLTNCTLLLRSDYKCCKLTYDSHMTGT